MTFTKTRWLGIWFLLFVFGLEAQTSLKVNGPKGNQIIPADSIRRDSINKRSSLIMGSDYASRVIFCGRDFGERQHGLSPYLMLELKSGLYFYTTTDFWSATERKP